MNKDILYRAKMIFVQLVKIASYTPTSNNKIVENKKSIIFDNEKSLTEYINQETALGIECVRRHLLELKLKGYYKFDIETGKTVVFKRLEDIPDEFWITNIPRYMRRVFKTENGSVYWNILDQVIFNYVDSIKNIHRTYTKNKNELEVVIKSIFYQKIDTIARRFKITRSEVIYVIKKFKLLFGKRCFRKALYHEKWHRKHPHSQSFTLEIPSRKNLKEYLSKKGFSWEIVEKTDHFKDVEIEEEEEQVINDSIFDIFEESLNRLKERKLRFEKEFS